MLPVEGQSLAIQLSSVQAVMWSMGFYQGPTASSSHLRQLSIQLIVYIDDILIIGETKVSSARPCDGLSVPIRELGFCSKPSKVHCGTNIGTGFYRLHSTFHEFRISSFLQQKSKRFKQRLENS